MQFIKDFHSEKILRACVCKSFIKYNLILNCNLMNCVSCVLLAFILVLCKQCGNCFTLFNRSTENFSLLPSC